MRTCLAAGFILLAGSTVYAQPTQPAATRRAATMSSATAPTGKAEPLKLLQTIPMPDVKGRLDHLAVDLKHNELFVAGQENNTLEVLDLAAGKRIASVTGLDEPQGVLYLPDRDLVVVTNGKTGKVVFLDRATRKPVHVVELSEDADNIRYDPTAQVIYVAYADGAFVMIDAMKNKWLRDISISAHPESFQLEMQGERLFANVPDSEQIAVLNKKNLGIVEKWPVAEAKKNYPMALDEANHRLFVGCREPAMLLVYDTESGKVVARSRIDGDVDDIFHDSEARRLYISCGSGHLDVVQQEDPDRYKVIAQVSTSPGARTCLYVPENRRLYLAVPQQGEQQAAVWVYEAGGK